MVNTNNKLITDIDSEFSENSSESELIRGKEALNNMIKNLFETSAQIGNSLGERPYENSYGCNLTRYLFEPLDDITALDIRDVLYDAITTFLPEFYVIRSSIAVVALYNENAYRVMIAYVYQGNPYDLDTKIYRKV